VFVEKWPKTWPNPFYVKITLARDQYYDFLNILPKNFAKKLALFAPNKAKLCKNWIITMIFDKNAIMLAKNRQKSQKIVIVTSTPGKRSQNLGLTSVNLCIKNLSKVQLPNMAKSRPIWPPCLAFLEFEHFFVKM
jgi:hypothetical protein